MSRILSYMLLASTTVAVASAQNYSYKPVEVASGAGFFDHFDFFTGADPTNGHVKYTGFDEANNSSLIGTISTNGSADGAVYIGVDYANQAPQGRKSVRLESKKTYGQHLMVVDVHHQPAVCGAWSALWALGPEWPTHGEIDWIESVHQQPSNRMSLHTKESLPILNHTQYMKGVLEEDQCAVGQDNVGCTVSDSPNSASSGPKFNANDGGIYVAEFSSSTGIQLWFFPRGSQIPADITAGRPNPSAAWGKPNGMFMADKVDWDKLFNSLKVIINTTFCGDWAGKVWATSECAALAPTCEEYVANNPAVFVDAYWAISSLTVYQKMLTS